MIKELLKQRIIEADMESLLQALSQFKLYDENYFYILKPLKNKPERPLGHHVMKLIHDYLYRSRMISESWFEAVNSENILTVAILTRAHMEVTGALAYLLKRMKSFYAGNIDYERLNDDLGQLLLGDKYFVNNPNRVEPVNILKFIDSVDDLYKKDTRNSSNYFREIYNMLSEYTHPNFLGVGANSKINKAYIIRFRETPQIDNDNIHILFHFGVSLDLFFKFFDEINEILLSNEELPIMIKSNLTSSNTPF